MRFYLAVMLFASFVCAGCGAGDRQHEALVSAPDFTLKGLDGNLVSLADFRGKVVLVDS